jgi:predicted secreted protein
MLIRPDTKSMTTRSLMAFVVLVGFLSGGCGPDKKPPALPYADRVIEYGTRSVTVKLAVGKTLLVSLPGAPSTGFFWRVEEMNDDILTKLDGDYVPDPETHDTPGGGGINYFRFEARVPGAATLRLVESRPPPSSETARSFSVEVEVLEALQTEK